MLALPGFIFGERIQLGKSRRASPHPMVPCSIPVKWDLGGIAQAEDSPRYGLSPRTIQGVDTNAPEGSVPVSLRESFLTRTGASLATTARMSQIPCSFVMLTQTYWDVFLLSFYKKMELSFQSHPVFLTSPATGFLKVKDRIILSYHLIHSMLAAPGFAA